MYIYLQKVQNYYKIYFISVFTLFLPLTHVLLKQKFHFGHRVRLYSEKIIHQFYILLIQSLYEVSNYKFGFLGTP